MRTLQLATRGERYGLDNIRGMASCSKHAYVPTCYDKKRINMSGSFNTNVCYRSRSYCRVGSGEVVGFMELFWTILQVSSLGIFAMSLLHAAARINEATKDT
jgi:hypothetical protein